MAMFSGSQMTGLQQPLQNKGADNKELSIIQPEDRILSQVTIKQILHETSSPDCEHVQIDGVVVSLVRMMAMITRLQVNGSQIEYKLSDYTGTLEATGWSKQAIGIEYVNIFVVRFMYRDGSEPFNILESGCGPTFMEN